MASVSQFSAEQAMCLLDFSNKMDMTLLDSVVNCFYNTVGPQVRERERERNDICSVLLFFVHYHVSYLDTHTHILIHPVTHIHTCTHAHTYAHKQYAHTCTIHTHTHTHTATSSAAGADSVQGAPRGLDSRGYHSGTVPQPGNKGEDINTTPCFPLCILPILSACMY